MSLKSRTDRYGTVAVSIHWLTAILIVMLIASGFRAADAADSAAKAQFLRVHVPIAVAVLALTVLRIVWWLAFDRRPDAAAGSSFWQERSSKAVHILFYILILGVAASGIGMMVLSGAGPVLFGRGGALPDFWTYPPRIPHGLGARILVGLLILHVGAALYHHFVVRDGLVSRIWFGR